MKTFHNAVLLGEEEPEGGDELIGDSFKYTIEDDVFYKFTLSRRKMVESGNYNTGANESQEEASESTDASVQEGIDAVMFHRLEEATIVSLKHFKAWIKKFGGAMKTTMCAKYEDPEVAKERLSKLQKVFKKLIADYDNLEFYCGEHFNSDGTLLIIQWDGTTPYGYLPVDGVTEVKH